MAVSILILKSGYLPVVAPTLPIYAPSSTNPKKVAIVKSIRFYNFGSSAANVRAWFKKGGGNFLTGAGARLILPCDYPLGGLCTLVEDAELTLDSGDGLFFQANSNSVHFVLCGVEQDVS